MTFSPAQTEQLLRPVNPRRVQKNDKGMSHLAAYDVSAHLTRIFGFGGWRKEILALDLVAEDGIIDPKRDRVGWYVTYRCSMRLHVGDWWNDDGATGSASNLPDRGDAHDFAMKNAISYALKRCAKDLGDQFGLSLYNKGSLQALVGRTLAGLSPQSEGSPSVDSDVPELAPDWDEQPPGREDGLPVNADGSLSRSRTSDAEKDAAGVMTAAMQKEHTALRPRERGSQRLQAVPDDDPWYDQGRPPPVPERDHDSPGTITREQQKGMHAAFGQLGIKDRDERLRVTRALVDPEALESSVASSSDLSYHQAGVLLERLRAASEGDQVARLAIEEARRRKP